jgi:hypothetical protein
MEDSMVMEKCTPQMEYTSSVNSNQEVLNVRMGFLFSRMDLTTKVDLNRIKLRVKATFSMPIMRPSIKEAGTIINLRDTEYSPIKMEVNMKEIL